MTQTPMEQIEQQTGMTIGQTVCPVQYGTSSYITMLQKWGYREGDLIELRMTCDDGKEYLTTEVLRIRYNTLKLILPFAWPITPRNPYPVRITLVQRQEDKSGDDA